MQLYSTFPNFSQQPNKRQSRKQTMKPILQKPKDVNQRSTSNIHLKRRSTSTQIPWNRKHSESEENNPFPTLTVPLSSWPLQQNPEQQITGLETPQMYTILETSSPFSLSFLLSLPVKNLSHFLRIFASLSVQWRVSYDIITTEKGGNVKLGKKIKGKSHPHVKSVSGCKFLGFIEEVSKFFILQIFVFLPSLWLKYLDFFRFVTLKNIKLKFLFLLDENKIVKISSFLHFFLILIYVCQLYFFWRIFNFYLLIFLIINILL